MIGRETRWLCWEARTPSLHARTIVAATPQAAAEAAAALLAVDRHTHPDAPGRATIEIDVRASGAGGLRSRTRVRVDLVRVWRPASAQTVERIFGDPSGHGNHRDTEARRP